MSNPIEVTESSRKTPLCPHCEQEIQRLNPCKVESSLGVRFVYFRDRCRKVPGLSHRKGFWMG